jgi:hypothetical protein
MSWAIILASLAGSIRRRDMKAPIEVKADILKAMLADDRLEVRTARSLVYSVISAFIIASFTLTSIALKPESVMNTAQTSRGDRIIFWIDLLIIPVMWVIFFALKRYVMHAQRCVHLRQDLMNKLDDTKNADHDLKIDIAAPEPQGGGIKHHDLWWMPIIGTIVVVLQLAVITKVH